MTSALGAQTTTGSERDSACGAVLRDARPLRVVVLLPEDHFHAPIVLRAIASMPATTVLAITTPKFTEFRGKPKGLLSVASESGFHYLGQMACMKLWYACRSALERCARKELGERRFLTVRDTLRALGCEHFHCNSASAKECAERIARFAPDLLFSVFFNQMVPPAVSALAGANGAGGAFNVHPAPLPAYRGISPAFWMLADGAEAGGVAIHELTATIDDGGVVARASVAILPEDSVFGLYRRSAEAAGHSVRRIIEKVRQGERPPPLPPAQWAGSYRSKITKEAVRTLRRRGRQFFRWSGQ